MTHEEMKSVCAIVALALACSTPAAAKKAPEPTGSLECYQFTWNQHNNGTSCDDYDIEDGKKPCYHPIILTVPQTLPPNVTDLEEKCSEMSCPTFTCVKDKQCLQWIEYDVLDKPVYMSVWCGSMVDTTNEGSTTVLRGATFSQVNETVTIRVKSCSYDKCNAGGRAVAGPLLLLGLLLLLWERGAL